MLAPVVSTQRYTNRQGNEVEVGFGADGRPVRVEVSGTGSHRAFQAQVRAAKKKAGWWA